MNAAMIDLETLSTKPGSLVLQVGICIADMEKKEVLHSQTFNLERGPQEFREIDADTVSWWIRQDRDVQDSVFYPSGATYSPDSAKEAISTLIDTWEVKTVWACPATFDLVILQDLWGSVPGGRRQQRDMLTLREELDPDRLLMPEPNKMQHNAEADSVWQMQYLFKLLEKMNG